MLGRNSASPPAEHPAFPQAGFLPRDEWGLDPKIGKEPVANPASSKETGAQTWPGIIIVITTISSVTTAVAEDRSPVLLRSLQVPNASGQCSISDLRRFFPLFGGKW